MMTSYKVLGFKIKHKNTGLFHGPAKIGCGYRWTKIGRTWNTRNALGASIAIWEDTRKRYRYPHMPFNDPENWVLVTMTDRGIGETPFLDYVAARATKVYPEPKWVTPSFTAAEIDMVSEACRNEIGDSDDAGELMQRVETALRTFMR